MVPEVQQRRPVTAEAAGTLVAFLETGALEARSYLAVRRLRELQQSEDFRSLPQDLQDRIRAVVDARTVSR
jgi:hypothetical protein